MNKLILLGILVILGIYLFVSAPPPIDSTIARESSTDIATYDVLDTLNEINSQARYVYTHLIVGEGKEVGLKFGEEWSKPDVLQGPLPAQFLRLISQQMERKPPMLGLYLGSDEPINKSNLFSENQMATFQKIKMSKAPSYYYDDLFGEVAMYPDVATVIGCVDCHNSHPDSPKKDWVLGDIMGATTWTYPEKNISFDTYMEIVTDFFSSIEEAYTVYLEKTRSFDTPPTIGKLWPGNNQIQLPSSEIFIDEVKKRSAYYAFNHLLYHRRGEKR